MAIVVAMKLEYEDVDILEEIYDLVQSLGGEVRMASVDEEVVAVFGPEDFKGGIMVISSYNTIGKMLASVVLQSLEDNTANIANLSGKVAIISSVSQGRPHLLNLVEEDPFASRVRIELGVDRTHQYKFQVFRKFPIPAQCNNNRNNFYPGMRRR